MLARELGESRSKLNTRYGDEVDGKRRRGEGEDKGRWRSSGGGGRISAIATDLKADSEVFQELYNSVSEGFPAFEIGVSRVFSVRVGGGWGEGGGGLVVECWWWRWR